MSRPPPTHRRDGGSSIGLYVRRVLSATAIFLVLYAAAFAYVELLVYRHGDQNSFFEVVAHDGSEAVVILGASHALPLKYQDMGALMQEALGTHVVNLAITGGGVVPNHLLMDFYLDEHGPEAARAVVYVLDSFAFYSSEWNEDRLQDDRLWERAPLDLDLMRSLGEATMTFGLDPTIGLKYVSGFTKLNDPSDWYAPDVWDAASEFEASYSASETRDQERIDYLYPERVDEETFDHYVAVFERLIERLGERDIPLVVVKPPLRDAFRARLPNEATFDERIAGLLEEKGVPLHDFSTTGFEADLFFDPDHLNREGVRRFLDDHLAPALRRHLQETAVRGATVR